MGVGASQGARAVRWGVAGNIVFAWILTVLGEHPELAAKIRAEAASGTAKLGALQPSTPMRMYCPGTWGRHPRPGLMMRLTASP